MSIALIAFLSLLGSPAPAGAANDPAAVVDRFNVAYNARDIDGLMAFFAPDAELIEFPDKVVAKGQDALRKRYAPRLAEPNLHVDVLSRIPVGERVIDRERIVRTFPEGPGIWDLVTITEVKSNRITRLWFIVGGKILDKK
jgi:putative hydrolase of HD superfamily